jgi:hemerythrin-like domain-containing protein
MSDGVTIIDGLVAEHRVFLSLFDQMERLLPGIKTVDEIALLCRLLERPLRNHGGAEIDLAYIALDHILKEKRRTTRLYHDHHELDNLLQEVATIQDVVQARARFRAALEACRAHFDDEERNVFPLIERAFQRETLLLLGKVWYARSPSSRRAAEGPRVSSRDKAGLPKFN